MLTSILMLIVWILVSALVLVVAFAALRWVLSLANVTIPPKIEQGIWIFFALLALIWCINHTHIGGVHMF